MLRHDERHLIVVRRAGPSASPCRSICKSRQDLILEIHQHCDTQFSIILVGIRHSDWLIAREDPVQRAEVHAWVAGLEVCVATSNSSASCLISCVVSPAAAALNTHEMKFSGGASRRSCELRVHLLRHWVLAG